MLVKNPRLVIRRHYTEFLVKNLDNNLLGRLNEQGYFIWCCLEKTTQPQEIADLMATHYGISFEQALADVETMLQIFTESSLLITLLDEQQAEVSTGSSAPWKFELPPAYKGPYIHKAGLVVTNKCNFACRHCYIDPAVKDTLSLDDWHRVILELKAMGCMEIMLTGGEPLLFPHLLDLLDILEREAFTFSINTNATLFKKEIIGRLAEYQFLSGISISIYGLTEATTLQVTKRLLNPRLVLDNCHQLVKAGLQPELKYIPMLSNLADLPLIPAFEAEYGLSISKVLQPLHPRCDQEDSPLNENIPFEQYAELLQQNLLTFTPNRNPLAHCGPERCSINSNGNVSMCEMTCGGVLGNIQQQSLSSIWQQHFHQWCPPESSLQCLECNVKEYCVRCDGTSFLAGKIKDGIYEAVPYLCESAQTLKAVFTRQDNQKEGDA